MVSKFTQTFSNIKTEINTISIEIKLVISKEQIMHLMGSRLIQMCLKVFRKFEETKDWEMALQMYKKNFSKLMINQY